MEAGSSASFEHALAHIIQEEELGPDFLGRLRDFVQEHEEVNDLYNWTMKLAPHLQKKEMEVMAQLLRNALKVLRNRKSVASEPADTLPAPTRQTLRELAKAEESLSEPALYVLGFDVLARAHNRARGAEPTAQA